MKTKSRNTTPLSTYVTQEIADAVSHLSEAEGKSISHWLRDIVRKAVVQNEPWKPSERREA